MKHERDLPNVVKKYRSYVVKDRYTGHGLQSGYFYGSGSLGPKPLGRAVIGTKLVIDRRPIK